MMHGLKAEYHRQKLMLKQQKYITDAGMDIYASPVEPEVMVQAGRVSIKVCTSLHLTPPMGTFGWVTSRSSTAKYLDGASVRAGIIDTGYTGELFVMLETNILNRTCTLEKLAECAAKEIAIAQFILLPALVIIPQMADEQQIQKIRQSGRGDNGFGSTSIKP